MANIQDVINNLSEEELDLLNSDPQMLAAFKAKYMPQPGQTTNPLPADVVNEEGAVATPFHPLKAVGDAIKGTAAGLFDAGAGAAKAAGKLITGQGTDAAGDELTKGFANSAADSMSIMNGGHASTLPGEVGEFVGSNITPATLLAQGGIAKVLEMSGIGAWAAQILKKFSESAALNAVGKIKELANILGSQRLDDLAQFLLKPVKIGTQELEPIIQATSSASTMKKAAEDIAQAAGKQLEDVAAQMDQALQAAAGEDITATPVFEDATDMLDRIKGLRNQVRLPNVSSSQAKAYEAAYDDVTDAVTKSMAGKQNNLFSELSKIKTELGDAAYDAAKKGDRPDALKNVYGVISDSLNKQVQKVSPELQAAYQQANAVYHQAASVAAALDGRALKAANWFDFPAIAAASTVALKTADPLKALVTAPATLVGAHLARFQAPQAIAAGLNAAAPYAAQALSTSIPIAANAFNLWKGLQEQPSQE